MIALLIAGVLVLCAGVLTIVFGIPIKEFSFGNTMILAGAIIACSGFVLIGLAIVVRELKLMAGRFDGSTAMPQRDMPRDVPAARASRSAKESPKAARPPARGNDDFLFSRDQQPAIDDFADEEMIDDNGRPMSSLPASSAPSLSDQWQDEPAAPPRRSRASAPPASADRAPPDRASGDRQRRDIMFSSKRRDEIEPEAPPREDEFSDRGTGQDGHGQFDEAWPQPERAPARNGRTPSARQSAPRPAEQPPVTIVKSGVVDAMAYSLYSDGSIEAQTPDGMVRFGSIEQLRAHLDQRT